MVLGCRTPTVDAGLVARGARRHFSFVLVDCGISPHLVRDKQQSNDVIKQPEEQVECRLPLKNQPVVASVYGSV